MWAGNCFELALELRLRFHAGAGRAGAVEFTRNSLPSGGSGRDIPGPSGRGGRGQGLLPPSLPRGEAPLLAEGGPLRPCPSSGAREGSKDSRP